MKHLFIVITPPVISEAGEPEYFGTELEMHRIEMIPCASPDEAMPLENLHNLQGDAVGVFHVVSLLGSGVFPQPVVRVVHADVEGYAVGMGALPFCAAHCAPVKGTAAFEVRLKFGMTGKFCGHGLKGVGGTVDGSEFHSLPEPRHIDELTLHFSR